MRTRPSGERPAATPHARDALRRVVGVTALVAPVLHSASDAIEWFQHGFSTPQLWLNYVAFLPMPWLLLGIAVVRERGPRPATLIGSLLYGTAFVYFAHTSLYALTERIPSYEALWERLGRTYTVHGALMVAGGLLFGWGLLREGWRPRFAVVLFVGGILLNLTVWLAPVPDVLQTLGSTIRNLGIVAMGCAVLAPPRATREPREAGVDA